MTVLYLSYDGLMEPLGQSQVFQYLRELAQSYKIILVTYEKKSDWADRNRREKLRNVVRQAGIHWVPLRYHKYPVVMSTGYDLIVGFFVCVFLCIRYRIRIFHARSYVPAALGLVCKRIFKMKFIFDMRCFWPDDLLEVGVFNKTSKIYLIVKWFERQFLIKADVIVALTQKAVDLMREFPFLKGSSKDFQVIPTCTNLDLFRPALGPDVKRNSANGPSFVLGYVGSAGPCNKFDVVLRCFTAIKRRYHDSQLLIVNRNNHTYIHKSLQASGIKLDSVEVKAVEYQDVPKEINRMTTGIFIYEPTKSQISRFPTKMGEFLACGVPCLGNSGIGDVKEILENEKVGVVLYDFSLQSVESALDQLLELVNNPEMQRRCVSVAQRYFSLEIGVKAYDCIYRDLVGKNL